MLFFLYYNCSVSNIPEPKIYNEMGQIVILQYNNSTNDCHYPAEFASDRLNVVMI